MSEAVRHNAARRPGKTAYLDCPRSALSWLDFDRSATALAEQLTGLGVTPKDRVAVWHGDSAPIHVPFVAIERCGAIVVGIGARAGTREATHILRSTRPRLLIGDPQREQSATVAAASLPIPALSLRDLSLDTQVAPQALMGDPSVGPDDVFLINSTSGTTGQPKCVVHTQNRWHYFHQKAVANG